MKTMRWIGLALLIIGVYILLDNFLPLPEGMPLIVLGIGFIIARYIFRQHGLMTPGMIITGVGCGVLLRDILSLERGYAAAVILASLGVAFLLLGILEYKHTGAWPFYPGGTLLVVAAVSAYLTEPGLRELLSGPIAQYWPIALIVVGLVILITAAVNGKKGNPNG